MRLPYPRRLPLEHTSVKVGYCQLDAVLTKCRRNALDAQATSIEVRLADRGLTLISVKDNGSGISPQDLALFAKPHHTSKITSDDALRSVKSFGFRGEGEFYSKFTIS